MADLCLRQGHRTEGLAIYRRLLARTTDEAARARMQRRMSALETVIPPEGGIAAPIPVPGVRARWTGDQLTIEWRLPAGIHAPGLEVLLVKTGPAGVSTETRAIAVDVNDGRLTLGAEGLHSARVAAGSRGPGGFVPLARG
ncbi:MAG: hypothetical protein H7X95_05710 [Deltaproteobacteria bacterium]|nr:hypothetical protein [Deltaproteobacteria bacterium]